MKILELARFSPSSHNTQPWKVSIIENKVVVGYEKQRHLRVGDPEMRELFLSLGCFIETVEQAARAYGYQMVCEYIGDGVEGVARLSFIKKGSADTSLVGRIKRRRSDRRKFAVRAIPAAEISRLKKFSRGQAVLTIFSENRDKKLLSDQTHKATLAAMGRNDFREELSGWVRNNWTKRPDGMPAYVQGIPGPVSLVAKTIIKKNPKVAPAQAKKDAKGVLNSSAIALVSVDRQEHEAWLDAGRLMQRTWLEATRLGLSAAAFSAAMVDADTARTIKKELRLSGQPVALLRLGYGKNIPKASPRRTLEQILA
jgi:nitroreductase